MNIAAVIHIANYQLTSFRNLINGVDSGFYKPDTRAVLGPKIIFFIIFSKGADIHIEYGAIQLAAGVFLGDHGFLDGVHAANGRAVAVAAPIDIS